MTDQPSVFAVENSNPPLTYEEIQEKYKRCSTQHGLIQANNGQTTKLYGCNQCKVYYHKTVDGWYMKKIQPAQYRLFGFKEEIVFSKEDEAKAQNLESLISMIPKGETIEVNKQEILLDLYNFIEKYKDHPRFQNVTMQPIRGIIKITKK